MKTLIISLILILFVIVPGFAQTGGICGKVLDRTNLQPLAGVNISLKGTVLGAATDADGQYVIEKTPVGVYSLEFSYIGYEQKIVPNVVVKSNRISYVNTKLAWQAMEGQEIEVSAGYFYKPEDAPVSVKSLGYEEIRRAPGAREDVSRMLQNLPGVSLTSDDRNDLVVRGGSPSEVLFTIDNIDIPNPNHFGTQGATGGPISMINAEFIDDVKFMAGGFTAPYGHKLSAVMDIKFREGSRKNYDGKVDLSVAGAGGYIEGPIQSGRGSFLFGAHRSYLDIMEALMDYGGIPVYSSIQSKVVYDLNKANQLSFLVIGGDDRIDIEDETEVEDFRPGITDTVDYNHTIYKSQRLTAGAGIRTFWHKNLYSIFSLSHSYYRFVTNNNTIRIEGSRTSDDELNNEKTAADLDFYDNTSVEQSTTLKSDWSWAFPNRDGLNFGAYVKLIQFEHDIDVVPISADHLNHYGQRIVSSSVRVDQSATPKSGVYLNYKKLLGKKVIVNLGGRYDYFDLLEVGNFSPRLGMRWNVSSCLAFKAGAGRYYQNPELLHITGDPSNIELLKDISADHFIAGLEYLINPDILFTLEVYHKKYYNYPVMADSGYEMISMANSGAQYGNVGSRRLLSEGEGKVSGLEVMIQKKLAEKVYGLISYSYSTIKHKALDGFFRDGEFDNGHVFSAVLGYRLSKNWEFSCKWRYAGGVPYTPFDEETSQQEGRSTLDLNRINEERLDPYHRLDLRFDHRRFFNKITLVTYFSVENVYNRENQRNAYWNNGQCKTDYRYQTGVFPVGGFSIEF